MDNTNTDNSTTGASPSFVFPTAKKFTVKDFLSQNPSIPTPVKGNQILANLLANKLVRKVGFASTTGRGRPPALYEVVNTTTDTQ